jgi:protease-4
MITSRHSKAVVAYTDGLMCSAAYYNGATSHIIANKRAAIGSIGVGF